MFICKQKINFISSFFIWYIAKILQTCNFWYFRHVWLWPVKTILSAYRKLWCLSWCIKPCLSFTYFLKYYKNIKLVILGTLGMPGHIHQKRWRQLVGNSDAYLQINNQLISPFFLGKIHFKESCNPIGLKNILGNNTRTNIFPDIGFAM